ncbi:MAG TPA: hypothetical protein VMB80_08625 [Candidatus Acidoferrum sp.]|nr:hypothetical protein [Candidatus Acidoferrum sp.]
MKKLPMADGRLPINGSFAGRGFARASHDGGQGIGLLRQRRQFFYGHNAGFDRQFQPQRSFVGFLFHCADFGNELRLAARTATGAVICRHGGSTAQNLPGNDAASIIVLGDRPTHFDDSQGESFGAGFQFGWDPIPKLRIQLAMGNRQSALSR